ncbi:sugar transferase [Enterococcus faecium]|nr:sugar transferase [Enterococcus faecium]
MFSAIALIVLLLFPFLFISLVLWIVNEDKKVFFKQQRVGKNEEIFTIYKFKTMTNTTDENGDLLPDEDRLTKLGELLRKTSLDELPQLINIIKGEMSFVGPRPLLVEYLPLYSKEQRKRHSVYPGLTGLAQINGRNAIKWEEKFELDIKYTKKISFSMDIKIILSTLILVIKQKNIGYNGSITTEKFVNKYKHS